MKQSAISVGVFGLYMAGQGLLLFLVPNFLLGMFGIPETNDIWIRILGIAVLILAYYYIRTSLSNTQAFFDLSTQGRSIQFVLFIALVISTNASLILIVLSAVEFLSGLWTYLAIRYEKSKETTHG